MAQSSRLASIYLVIPQSQTTAHLVVLFWLVNFDMSRLHDLLGMSDLLHLWSFAYFCSETTVNWQLKSQFSNGWDHVPNCRCHCGLMITRPIYHGCPIEDLWRLPDRVAGGGIQTRACGAARQLPAEPRLGRRHQAAAEQRRLSGRATALRSAGPDAAQRASRSVDERETAQRSGYIRVNNSDKQEKRAPRLRALLTVWPTLSFLLRAHSKQAVQQFS